MIVVVLKRDGEMKKLSLIILLCMVLTGCKTIRSHVEKRYTDSLHQNRETSKADLMAISVGTHTTTILTDSNTRYLLRLDSFSGVISPEKIEGRANRVDIIGTVDLKKKSASSVSISDSLIGSKMDQKDTRSRVESRHTEKHKETKGSRPWWVWPVGIVAMLLVAIYFLYKVKSKLKLF